MTATEELRHLLDERGVEYKDLGGVVHFDDSRGYYVAAWNAPRQYGDILCVTHKAAPEQAIAATLGSVPDEIELTQTYDAGFRNGVMAVFQQLEGIEDYEGLQDLIAEYWAEGEGNDER